MRTERLLSRAVVSVLPQQRNQQLRPAHHHHPAVSPKPATPESRAWGAQHAAVGGVGLRLRNRLHHNDQPLSSTQAPSLKHRHPTRHRLINSQCVSSASRPVVAHLLRVCLGSVCHLLQLGVEVADLTVRVAKDVLHSTNQRESH